MEWSQNAKDYKIRIMNLYYTYFRVLKKHVLEKNKFKKAKGVTVHKTFEENDQ